MRDPGVSGPPGAGWPASPVPLGAVISATQRVVLTDVTYQVVIYTPPQPDAPPLLLLHGFTGSAANWDQLAQRIAADGWRVIAIDHLGHGASSMPGDPSRYAIDRVCADLVAILTQLGLHSADTVILGYSMGGRVALAAVTRSPYRAAILESATPGIADPAERAARQQSDADLAERIERDGVPAFVDYWTNLPLFASQRGLAEEVRLALRAQRLTNRAVGLANSLRGLGTGMQPDLGPALADLRLPVLLIAGALDTKYVAIAQAMAQALPAARLAIVPGVGHTVHLEAPAVYDEQVRTYLKHLRQANG